MQLARSCVLAAALFAALPAAGLVIRADRDDAEYLELASRYTSSVPLSAPQGEAVLIAPRWLLTAAHRARALQDARPRPRVSIGGNGHAIAGVYLHPDWKGGAAADIALVHLDPDVGGIDPTPPYRGNDESGKTVAIAGHGGGKKRASINTVDRVEPRSLALRIKPLDDASDLQGQATAEETGGPAYLQVSGELYVVGILHGIAGGWETHARVSAFAGWIDATLLEVAAKEAAALLGAQ